MKAFKIGYTCIILLIFISSFTYAFDTNLLSAMLKEEMKRITNHNDIQIGQIKFIGFAPTENCNPQKLKITEIKRPSSVEFTFYCGTRQYRAIANYEIMATIYISQRILKRGDSITEADIIEIKKPLSKIPSGAIMDRDEIIGRIVKRTLAQGLIIKNDHLYSGIPVKRGSKVFVMINAGQVSIMTEGVLKSDATVGDLAKVQCLQTGKEIVGKLIEKDKVRVSL